GSNMESIFKVVVGDWDKMQGHAYPIRYEVFVSEQQVPVELELDDDDAVSLHAVAFDQNGQAVGTGRLLPDGHIGRMAVRAQNRGQGIGRALLMALLEEARAHRHEKAILSAQWHARAFYAKLGFVPVGDVFMEAGIRHV